MLARNATVISGVVVCASILANVALFIPSIVDYFFAFIWIHVAIVFLGIWSVFRLRKIKSTWTDITSVLKRLPVWIVVLGIAVVIMAGFRLPNVKFDVGKLPDGTSIHSKNWYEKEGKYFLSVNKAPATEISKFEYDLLRKDSYAVFGFFWLLFSYAILLEWFYIWNREKAHVRQT